MFSRIRIPSLYLYTISLGLIAAYLWGWKDMPLYPDEVSFHLQTARFGLDRGMRYGLYPLCVSGWKHVPVLLWPAAYLFSFLSRVDHWQAIRLLPGLCVFFFVGSIAYTVKAKRYNDFVPLLLTTGFIGVAGSSLLFMRAEPVLLLHAGMCVLTCAYLQKNVPRRDSGALALILLNLLVAACSFYVHLQGFLLAPVTFLLLARLLRVQFPKRGGLLVVVLGAYMLVLLRQAYQFFTFFCAEDPGAGLDQSISTIVPHLSADFSAIAYLNNHLLIYIERFVYICCYQINYLPSLTTPDYIERGARLEPLITSCLIFNFLIVACVMFGLTGGFVVRMARALRARCALWDILSAPATLLAYSACAWMMLYFYDYTLNFYRAISLNLLAAGLVTLVAANIKNPLYRTFFAIYGAGACILCLLSIVMNGYYFTRPLQEGYTGPSLPLATPWREVDKSVEKLSQQCGFTADMSHIVVEDYTYDALKSHRHVMPFSYFWFRVFVPRLALSDFSQQTPALRAQRLHDLAKVADGMLARCIIFDVSGIPFSHREQNLCCRAFDK